jgi:hypothetical protein
MQTVTIVAHVRCNMRSTPVDLIIEMWLTGKLGSWRRATEKGLRQHPKSHRVAAAGDSEKSEGPEA